MFLGADTALADTTGSPATQPGNEPSILRMMAAYNSVVISHSRKQQHLSHGVPAGRTRAVWDFGTGTGCMREARSCLGKEASTRRKDASLVLFDEAPTILSRGLGGGRVRDMVCTVESRMG